MTLADAMMEGSATYVDKSAQSVDLWVDLFATSLARNGALGNGLPVVLTDTLRVMPLLESQGPVGWIHAAPWHYQDHVLVAQGQPASRPRVDALRNPGEAGRMLGRAGLCLV